VTEAFRDEWGLPRPVQWNLVHSEAGVLRGVHVHLRHHDYLVLAQGRMTLGLHDLRPGAAAGGLALELDASAPVGIAVPPGVAHGFYFPEPAVYFYSVTSYWDPADELGCRWDDAEIPWPAAPSLLSERDERAGSLKAVREAVVAALT
jgi:dTDP-4-dehydrorhamnose 3,5-epimerase